MGDKPSDEFINPLCAGCHRLAKHAQHNRSEKEFWAALGIDPLESGAFFYKHTGDYETCWRYIRNRGVA